MRTLLGALAVLAFSGLTWAEDPPAKADPKPDASRGIADEAKNVPLRTSAISGMKVINPAGKELGSVNDVVLDVSTGKVRYAALAYGGFLGVGNKLFAVPWNLFTVKWDAGGKKHYLMLDISEETLKNAPGFDSNHWPTFADQKAWTELEAHYNKGTIRK